MRRLFASFALAAIAILPLATSAQILPACDQTVYLLPNASDPVKCHDEPNETNCQVLSPAEYDTRFPTQAEKEQNPPIVTTLNQCGFNDFVQLFINLANWGLGILAVLALVFAIYGGFTLLTSAGNPDRVRQGKSTIWGGFLGVGIVLTAWVLVGFVVSALSGSGPVLFAGTRFARTFAGRSPCPANYRACAYQALQRQCRDDQTKNQNGVTKAQTILAQLGCYLINIDGCFGPRTDAAVRAFQTANAGCAITVGSPPQTFTMPNQSDGIIGNITWTFLDAAKANGTMTCGGSPTPVPIRGCRSQ